MAKDTYYITTPIFYPNGAPHIGHAYTAIATDVMARFQRLDGKDVFFLSGTDEHGQKMQRTAEKEGIAPIELADRNSAVFRDMLVRLNCSNDDFIRTTEHRHKVSSQAIWKALERNGDIYLGCGGTLTVDTNYLRSVGKMYRSRKDTDASEGTVQIRRWVENPFDASEPEEYVKMYSRSQMDSEGVTTDSGYDSAFTEGVDANGDGDFYDEDEWMPWGPGALENWSQPDMYADGEGSTVLSGTHGVTEAVVPNIGSISMFEEEDGGDHEWNEAMGRYTEVAAGTGTHSKGFFHGTPFEDHPNSPR